MRHLATFASGALAISALAWGPRSSSAQAGVVVQQHTTFNVAKTMSSDLTQTLSILGADRAKTVTTGKIKVLIISSDAAGTDITRLDKDSIYRVNDKKKEYTARSLADMRAELAKQQQDAEKQANEGKKQDEMRYSVEGEAKATGEKQTINGFSTEQVLIKLTVWGENTKTGVKSVAYYITADSWVDKSQSEANHAMMAFRMAQQQALGVDPTMAANPYAKWLTNVSVEMGKIDGYPIRTTVTCEMPPDTTAAAAKKADAPPTSVSGAVMGAMFGAKKKDPEPASPHGGVVVSTSMTEVTSISFKAPAASEFEIPKGYMKK